MIRTPFLAAATAAVALISLPLLAADSAPAAGGRQSAVAGDSRNCGDIVMPSIAAGAKNNDAQFYWHLGDFRALFEYDEDMQAEAEMAGKTLDISTYLRNAWPDFLRNQIAPLEPLPAYLSTAHTGSVNAP